MTDPAAIALLRDHVAAHVAVLETLQAARLKPLPVYLMECVLGVAVGTALGFLVAMLLQGFTLYDGYDVPGLIDLWSGGSA